MSGLFGVGGAVISTPAIRALGASAAVSVGTTLPAIIPGAASGTARYLREGLIDWRLVRWAGPTGAVTAVLGSVLSRAVPGNGHILMLMTAALLGYSALRMYETGSKARPVPQGPGPRSDEDDLPPLGLAETERELAEDEPDATSAGAASTVPAPGTRKGVVIVIGAVAGLLSGLLGVGGGIVVVPGLTQFAKVPLKQAIATSLACVAIFAVPGTITHAIQRDIDWRFALLLALGVVPGARLGANLSLRTEDKSLRILVAAFLGLTAVLYAGGEIRALMAVVTP